MVHNQGSNDIQIMLETGFNQKYVEAEDSQSPVSSSSKLVENKWSKIKEASDGLSLNGETVEEFKPAIAVPCSDKHGTAFPYLNKFQSKKCQSCKEIFLKALEDEKKTGVK